MMAARLTERETDLVKDGFIAREMTTVILRAGVKEVSRVALHCVPVSLSTVRLSCSPLCGCVLLSTVSLSCSPLCLCVAVHCAAVLFSTVSLCLALHCVSVLLSTVSRGSSGWPLRALVRGVSS